MEFMIWATVSSWSYFSWLYRTSPSLAAKNIISLISVLTIWWCPCVESSLVLLEEGVCYDQGVLLAKLLAFALLHSIYQGQICLLLQVFLYFLLLHSSPLCIFSVTGWGIGLDHRDIEWFALEMNRDHSVVFEIASKYCILDCCWQWWVLHFF